MATVPADRRGRKQLVTVSFVMENVTRHAVETAGAVDEA
jgi:hypothetical protein